MTGSRRPPGAGSRIIARADGWLEIKVSLGRDPLTGKRVRRSVYGRTPAEVEQAARALLVERDRGMPTPAVRLTVAAYLDRWLEESVRPAVRATTYARYRRAVEQHLKPGLGHVRLVALTPEDVERLLWALRERGRQPRHEEEAERVAAAPQLSARTVLFARAVLRRALAQALRRGLVARNVATLVDPPPAERYEGTALEPEQARALLTASRGTRLEGLVAVALCLGLRQGEALGLSWADVDLDGGTVAVRRQLQRVDGRPELVALKSGRSRRTLPLPEVVAAALRAHRARQELERRVAGDRWQKGGLASPQAWGLVFTTAVGTPWSPRNLTRDFHRLLARAGLPPLRWHDLRHSAGSLLYARGVDLPTIMAILGHSQISVTADTYLHLAPAGARAAAAAMDAALEPPVPDGRMAGRRQTGTKLE